MNSKRGLPLFVAELKALLLDKIKALFLQTDSTLCKVISSSLSFIFGLPLQQQFCSEKNRLDFLKNHEGCSDGLS